MLQIEPQSLIGTWRRFGVVGPVYEIVSEGKILPTGDETLRVRLLRPARNSITSWLILSRPEGALMFAIAFDLVVEDTAENHPKGVSQAYADIRGILTGFGFSGGRKPLHHRKRRLGKLVCRNHGTKSVAVVSCIRAGYSRI